MYKYFLFIFAFMETTSTIQGVADLPVVVSELDAQIAKFKAEYSNMVVVDQATLTGAKAAVQVLTKFRTGADKRRKDLIAPALEWQRSVNREFDRIVSETKPMEGQIATAIRQYEHAEEEKRKAKERERIMSLEATGFRLFGHSWSVGTIHVDAATVLKLDDEAFDNLIKRGKIEAARVEEERIRKDQAAKELAELEAKLAAKRAELAAIEKPEPEPEPEPVQQVVVTTVEMVDVPTIDDAPFDLEPQSKPVSDPFKTAFNEGKQYVKDAVLKLLADKSITSRAVLVERISKL